MKVLFVSSGNSHYGVAPFVKSQGESLKKEGVELDFYQIKGKGFKGYYKNIKPLREFIKKNEYDVIHAHYGLIGFICLLTFSGKPMVLSVMGDDAYGKFGLNGKRAFSSYFVMLITQITLLFVDQVVAKSNNILNYIPYKKKSHIVPNGVNFDIFKPDSSSLEPNVVLFLADVNNERKNFKLLKDALMILDDNTIKLVNPFPIANEDFPKYLNRSSVFVLTSYSEGSPNVIKETMACNIPIVSTDVGDVSNVISNTKGCYLVDFDPNDVAEKLKEALDFNKRTTGRKDIAHLESSIIAKKIISVYNMALKK